MGSLVYARRCRERGEQIEGMLSIETIGCYSGTPDSQRYPHGFPAGLPAVGNFLGFAASAVGAGFGPASPVV